MRTTVTAPAAGSVRRRVRRRARLGDDLGHRLLYVASPLVLLAGWQLGTRLGWLDERYFPAPTDVAAELWETARDGVLLDNLLPTLRRVFVGLLLGVVPGIALGPLVGYSRLVRSLVQPLVDLTFPIPKIAVFPLFLIIFGIGDTAIYAVTAVSIVYLVLINCADGVRNLSATYADVARDSGASRRMMFFDVALPGALPPTLSGIRLAANVALLVVVATEFVGSSKGMGFLVWNSWQLFQVSRMFAGLIVLALVGFAVSVLLRWLERVLVPWNR